MIAARPDGQRWANGYTAPNPLRILGCMAIVTIPLMADPAIAQPTSTPTPIGTGTPGFDPARTRPGPAPLIGVGLPMVGAVLLALLLVRRFGQKH